MIENHMYTTIPPHHTPQMDKWENEYYQYIDKQESMIESMDDEINHEIDENFLQQEEEYFQELITHEPTEVRT